MPIYEYRCAGCDTIFEVFQKMSDPPPTEHACGSREVQRILSRSSFVLKGTGWYATDYGPAKGGDDKKGEANAKSESGSDAGAKAGGDAKPAKPDKPDKAAPAAKK